MMQPSPRKIAVVIPKYGLVGGAEGFAAEVTARIALNPRYDIHVFANRWTAPSERITFHKVPIIRFPKFLKPLSFAWFAGRMIAREGFDLVHAQDRMFSADLFTMHGIPHRLWVREIRKKSMGLSDYATDRVERSIVASGQCRQFLAVSGLAKEKFLQVYGTAPSEKIQIVHPGVDAERFLKLDRQLCRREIRAAYGIGAADTVILFVSMNFDIKGLDRLIEALAVLKSGHPEEKFKLLVVGKGNTRKYAALAKKMGIADEVVFAGLMGKEKLSQAYMASDIFSILSRFDTFGLVVLEAMAASLPVVISSNVGAKDLVRNGISGFIVNGESGAAAISGKIALLFDKERRKAMGEQARATARAGTWEEAAKRVSDIYETLLSRRPDVLSPHLIGR